MLFSKTMYALILLSIVNFLAAILPQGSADNTLLRLNNDNTLEGYIVLSRKGETYLFSSLVREYFQDLKIENNEIFYSYNDQLKKQPYFMSVFSDDIAELSLYPNKLIQDNDFNYILNSKDYKDLLKDNWVIRHGKTITLFLPVIESCNQFKIMIFDDTNVFLKPICKNQELKKV